MKPGGARELGAVPPPGGSALGLDTSAAGLPAHVANALDVTLKKFQQLVQELGRSCECPVCYKAVRASETNPEHESFMKLLYCGHFLCGDCAATMKECEDKRSDSNSQKTIQKVTHEFEEAKARLLECRNTSSSDLLERERGEKRKLEEEVRRLKRRLASSSSCSQRDLATGRWSVAWGERKSRS